MRASNSISVWALPQTPLGELTAPSPNSLAGFKGLLLREERGKRKEGKKMARQGGEGKEKAPLNIYRKSALLLQNCVS